MVRVIQRKLRTTLVLLNNRQNTPLNNKRGIANSYPRLRLSKGNIMKKTNFSLTIIALLLSSVASAESWDIYQRTANSQSMFTTLNQKNNTSNSLQSMNAANPTTHFVHRLTQSASGSDTNIILQQTDNVSASTQAMNHFKVGLNFYPYALQSNVYGNTFLSQTTSGANVIQGANIIDTVRSGYQGPRNVFAGQYSVSDTLSEQQHDTNQAIQTANGIITGDSVSLTGSAGQLTLTGRLTMSQNAANNSIQAANYLGSAQ